MLFLIFINDIACDVNSSIRLLADDCLIYHPITCAEDHDKLQQDLDHLYNWSQTWLMEFNVDKCQSMQITLKKKHKSNRVYTMGGQALALVKTTPYLGVLISSDLKWNVHIDSITAKARRILGMLRRNLQRAPQKVKAKAYQTLVRPRLEYCSSIWSPK